jgi:pyruvate/2-oxoglutarate dehydrogenase complex dihydrolipoamide dehydrogenase (E3) component
MTNRSKRDINPANLFPELYYTDEHDRELTSYLFPEDWENPEPSSMYDLVVIGAGTGGLTAAFKAAGVRNTKVALIERRLIGGVCNISGCIPTKTFIKSSRVANIINNAEQFGIDINGEIDINFPKIMERVRSIRKETSKKEDIHNFEKHGIHMFLGNGGFVNNNTIEVEGKKIHFKKAIIATGTRPNEKIRIEGVQTQDFITNETVFQITDRPQSLIIIGGGTTGCELAQAFHRLGTKVTIIQETSRLLDMDDRDISEIIQNKFKEEGIDIYLDSHARQFERVEGQKRLVITTPEGEKEITASSMLFTIGRIPNIDHLKLDAANINYDKKLGILVNNYLQTSNENVFAIGDVCLPDKFTHVANESGKIAVRNALFNAQESISDLVIPRVVYTDPEIAEVGMNEQTARKMGVLYEVIEVPFSQVSRAITDSETEGKLKMLVSKDTEEILGATIVTQNAGDIINEITFAMTNKLDLNSFAKVIHPFPTRGRIIHQAAIKYLSQKRDPVLV